MFCWLFSLRLLHRAGIPFVRKSVRDDFQNPSKIHAKTSPRGLEKTCARRPLSVLATKAVQEGPKTPAKAAQEAPKTSRSRSRSATGAAQDTPRSVKDVPKRFQDGPRRFEDSPRRLQDVVFHVLELPRRIFFPSLAFKSTLDATRFIRSIILGNFSNVRSCKRLRFFFRQVGGTKP